MAEVDAGAAPQIYFLTAPALETVFAVNALAHPELRPFLAAWAADVEARLTEGEREHLTTLRRLPELLDVADLTILHRCFQDVAALTGIIAGLTPDEFAALLLGRFVTAAQVAEFRAAPERANDLRKQHPWLMNGDEAALRAIVYEPAAVQAAYVSLLPRVWELGVQPMLDRLEPHWEETIAQAESEAEGKDPKSFALSVFGGPFARRYGPDHVFDQYLFAPTYFFSPMRVALFEPDISLITLDCRLGPWTNLIVRKQVIEGLRAITDENRLAILRVLNMDKGFGAWVAKRLKLNPATVTHHMNQLRAAGLLQEVEGPPGAAKYYRTDREALQKLIKLLQDYVDANIEPDWEGAKQP